MGVLPVNDFIHTEREGGRESGKESINCISFDLLEP